MTGLGCVLSLSHVWLFVTPWTAACPAPLSMEILQARILEWVACPPPGNLPNPGIEPMFPTVQVDSLPSEPPGKAKKTGVGSLSFLQGIFSTQESAGDSCLAEGFFTSWASRKARMHNYLPPKKGMGAEWDCRCGWFPHKPVNSPVLPASQCNSTEKRVWFKQRDGSLSKRDQGKVGTFITGTYTKQCIKRSSNLYLQLDHSSSCP